MSELHLYVWKFIIGEREHVPDAEHPKEITWSGYVAVAIAETEAEAREVIRDYAARDGLDARWLAVAHVRRIEITSGTFVAWAEK